MNMVGKLIQSYDEKYIDEYFKRELLFPAENNENVLCLPILHTQNFIIISTLLDTNGILLYTENRQLSILPEVLPIPIKIVDLNNLWQQKILGKNIDQEQVFYWCENNKTSLVQRLEWRTNNKGPYVLANKYLKIFETTRYQSVVQGVLHDLLSLQPMSEALQHQFDLLTPTVEPVQE